MKESSEKTKSTNEIRFEKDKTIFILCDCKSEVLVLEYDHEYGLMDLSIYENLSNYSNKMSFWQKLRYIYQILVEGKPYSDQMVLNKEQMKYMTNFLISIN